MIWSFSIPWLWFAEAERIDERITGAEIILIAAGAVLTLGVLGFFIWVFTRKQSDDSQ